MARNPQDRYASALEMKQDLDHPEIVKLTGRSERLVVPNPISGNLQRYRLVLIAVVIPIIVFLAFLFFSKFKITSK
jgi:hypothetical protein